MIDINTILNWVCFPLGLKLETRNKSKRKKMNKHLTNFSLKQVEEMIKVGHKKGRKEREAEIIEILEDMKLLGHISKYALQDIKEQIKEAGK